MSRQQIEKLFGGDGVNDILMELKTDAAGRFRFQDVSAPAFPQITEVGQSVFPWDIVALAEGRGLAWVPLTTRDQRTPITLKLGPEGLLRGRVVEPGGKAIAGAKVQVSGIDPLGRLDENGLATENRLNLSWSAFPLGATTDQDGRFIIRGLARDKIATLIVTEPRHERLYTFAATTDVPQPDFISDRVGPGKSERVRWPIHTGELTLTAKVADHVFSGKVVYEADGKPAAKAVVIHQGIVINADENGRFRLDGLVAGPLELHATVESSDHVAAPLDVSIEIPETPREIERNLVLPRGLVLNGRVVDGASGQGVEKALVEFNLKSDAGQMPILFGFSKETAADGRFRLVVPPGRGTVVVRRFPAGFPQPERTFNGQPEDPKYSREVEGRGGQTIKVPDFKLARGREIVLRVLDAEGRPVADAQVDIRDFPGLPGAVPGRTDASGRHTLVGLPLEAGTVIDIVAAKRSLGATVEIADPISPAAGDWEVVVRLEPLISLSGRVLDEAGNPIVGPIVHLYRDVMYPGQSRRSFGLPVGTVNETSDDGSYTFENLIPGATYNTQVEASGYPNATSAHVTVKPGQPVRLDDYRLPAVDRELKGIVVDPRGTPLSGFVVNYERTGKASAFYAPSGGRWFQDSDGGGRFHLSLLPRGPIRLMVYRKQEGAGRQIEGIQYFDIRADQTEVRIEMRDDNDRLRGID
jgi:protocatechuate 3,4-dioxygenase beta subunit